MGLVTRKIALRVQVPLLAFPSPRFYSTPQRYRGQELVSIGPHEEPEILAALVSKPLSIVPLERPLAHAGLALQPSDLHAPLNRGGYAGVLRRMSRPGFRAHSKARADGVERDSNGKIKRSAAARHAFRERTSSRAPPGCQVDHVIPLAKGGPCVPANMQLLCGEALRDKEATELR